MTTLTPIFQTHPNAWRRGRRERLAPAAAALAFVLSASPAVATDAGVPPRADADFPFAAQLVAAAPQPLLAFGDDDTLAFAAAELGQERLTKGAPYCADAVHETVQWLPDGAGGAPNRIVRRQTTKLCRDGEGRTRQEVERGNRTLVYLRDPVARESWVLDPQRRTARKLAATAFTLRGDEPIDHSAWRDYAERMRDWARDFGRSFGGEHGARVPAPPPVPAAPRAAPLPPVPRAAAVPPTPPTAPTAPTAPTPPMPPTPSTAAPPPSMPTPVAIERHEGDRVRIVRVDGAAPALPLLPPTSWHGHGFAPRGAGVSTPLPARDIDGMRAHGQRTTWTIEAGKIGNERPIEIVREVWTSPELLLTLATRDFDPRRGEVNYRLQNLRRGEPDAALMRVPSDYTQPSRAPRGAPPAPSAPRG